MYKRLLGALAVILTFSHLSLADDSAPKEKTFSEKVNEVISPATNGFSKVIFYQIPMTWLVTPDCTDPSYLKSSKPAARGTEDSPSDFARAIVDRCTIDSVADPATGEVIAAAGTLVTDDLAAQIAGTSLTEVNVGDAVPGLPIIVVWLLSFAIFFTVYMGFINLRGFGQAIRIVKGTYDNPDDPGEVTHFQALTAALSATVGLGNIAGVALAISLGGPGATFWMILAGLFGMTSKFCEVTLGHKYRDIDEHGVVSGGPMKYLSKGLAGLGMPNVGKTLSVIFALICILGAFGAGNMFQANQATEQLTNIAVELTGGADSFFMGKAWIFGLIYAGLLSFVIVGGIRGITHVTEFLVPIMAAIYVIAALAIIGAHFTEIPAAFGLILKGAFTGEGITGGIIGVLILGLRRATFSNEAGLGTASIAHAAAKTKEPVAEGLVALIEPFVDTVVICTMTALVIILTGAYMETSQTEGIALTSMAFDSFFDGFRYVLTIAVPMFAFSTTITYYYYGERALDYLTKGGHKHATNIYKASYLLAIIVGSAMKLTAVMDFADAALLALGFPNLVGVFLLRKEVKALLDDYWSRLKAGKIKPYVPGKNEGGKLPQET